MPKLLRMISSILGDLTDPTSPGPPGDHTIWRERLLKLLLFTGATLGALIFIPILVVLIREGKWGLLIVDSVGILAIAALLVFRRLPYGFRAACASLILYSVGVGVITHLGPFSGGPAYLFCFSVIAGVLLGMRAALVALVLNTLTMAVIGGLALNGYFPQVSLMVTNQGRWLVAGISFVFLNAVATISVTFLVKGLQTALQRETHIKSELQARQQELEQEVAARAETQQRLSESEDRFRLFSDEVSFDGLIISIQGIIIDVNQPFAGMYGYRKEELIGTDLFATAAPESRDEVRERVEGGKVDVYEIMARRKDGTTFPVEISAKNVVLAGKNARAAAVRDITARKAAEAELLEREKWYRTTFEHTGTAMLVADENADIIMANDKLCQMIGLPREEVVGKIKWHELVDESELPRMREFHRQRREGGDPPESYEVLFKDHQGNLKRVLHYIKLIPNTLFNVSSVIDITERKEAEEALVASEERYRGLIGAVPDPVVVYDALGNVTYVNEAFEQTYGWTLQEMMEGQVDWVPKDEQETTSRIWTKQLDSGVGFFQTKRRTKQGEVIDVDIRGTSLREHDGSYAGAIVVHRNITESKRAEKALRNNEKRLQTILAANPDPVVVYDLSGHPTYVNPAFSQVFGWELDELAGGHIPFVSPDQRELTARKVQEVYEQSNPVRFESKRQTKDGKLIEVFVSAARIADDDDDLLGMVVSLTDITEIKSLEARLRQSHKMEAVGTLAGGIAHDFNNILSTIMGFGELAQMAAGKGQDNSKHLDQIVKAAERARDLVQQILAFSRKSETDLKPLDLNQLVTRSVKILGHTIPKMIDIQMNLAGNLDYVLADPTQVEQVLMNLASNASDAMPEGGRLVFETGLMELGPGSGHLRPEMPPGRYVVLSVTDTGQGMDKETMVHAFDPFFTTKDIGAGTGLGLSSVYGIVREHGGHISCYSELGLGATFRIYLPAYAVEQDSAKHQELEQAPLPGGTERLLVVDDEAPIRKIAVELLQDVGYRVTTRSSGEEALQYYQAAQDQVDLVILDLGMPGMGGHKCLRRLLALNPDIKVLIASGYSANGKVKDTLGQGAADFIAKPFRRSDLLQSVRSVLDA